MKSIDPLLPKQYDAQHYHCIHFLIDAAKYLLEQDYSNSFLGLTGSLDQTIQTSRSTVIQNKRLDVPINGCIVLMTNLINGSHVGLFYCDRVLHLSERGVRFETLRSLDRLYSRFRFYEAQNISQ